MKKSILLPFYFFWTTLSFSSPYSICLKEEGDLKLAKKELKKILAPVDQAYLREISNCLDIKTDSKLRFNFYKSYLGKKFRLSEQASQGVRDNQDDISFSRCRIRIREVTKTVEQKRKAKLGRRSKLLDKKSNMDNEQISTLLLSSGKTGSLGLDGNFLGVVCFKKAKSFSVEIFIRGKKGNISTSLSLRPRQEVNIGQIANELNEKDKNIDFNDGLGYERDKFTRKHDYYLSVE